MTETVKPGDGINPNAEVSSEGKIDAGAESVSFDEIEDVTATAPIKTDKEKPEKSQKEQEKTAAKPAKDGEEKAAADDEGNKVLPGSEQRANDSAEAKKIKARSGDQEIELSSDTKFTHKVAGESEEVNLQTLLDNYSGKTNWDRKYNELSTEKKTFTQERDFVNSKIVEAHKAAQEGDSSKFIHMLASMSNQDPVEVQKQMMQPLIDFAMELAEKSPEEREAYMAKMELDTYKTMHNSQKEHTEKQNKLNEYNGKVKQAKEGWNISDSDWNEATNRIAKGRDPSEVEPMEVVRYHNGLIAWAGVNEALPDMISEYEQLSTEYDKSGLERIKDERDALELKIRNIWLDLTEYATKEKLGVSDITEIAKNAFGGTKTSRAAKEVAQKVAKTQSEKSKRPSQTPDDPLSFDQL